MKNGTRPLILPMLALAALLSTALAVKDYVSARNCVVPAIYPPPDEPCLRAAERLPGSVGLAIVLVLALVGYYLFQKSQRSAQ